MTDEVNYVVALTGFLMVKDPKNIRLVYRLWFGLGVQNELKVACLRVYIPLIL